MWIDPYPTRLPKIEDMARNKSIDRPAPAAHLRQSTNPDWLELYTPGGLPLEPIPGAGWVNRVLWAALFRALKEFNPDDDCFIVVGKPSALALQVLSRHPKSEVLYDAMDDFPSFYDGISRWSMMHKERILAKRAHWIAASSTRLASRLSKYASKLLIARNACDSDLPAPTMGRNTRPRSTTRQILGYVGTIGAWFDWDLVIRLAQSNPDHLIRLIGPMYNPPGVPLPQNIELLPACNHSDAIGHMQTFAAGLIPFKITTLTASVDPIKYYEYRALGLPVISTRFGEMSLRDNESGVFLLDASSDLAITTQLAMSHIDTASSIEHFRQQNSWESRFETAYASLEVLKPSVPAGPVSSQIGG